MGITAGTAMMVAAATALFFPPTPADAAAAPLAACPDLATLRSERALKFNASLATGFFYEMAYHDIAQVGASCPTLNFTRPDADNTFSAAFRVKYIGKLLPFTITEVYTKAGSDAGVYSKRAKMPGSKLLTLPTVVVDATVGVDGLYDSLTLYSCLKALGVAEVQELNIMTRTKAASADVDALVSAALQQGVPVDDKGITRDDHSKCDLGDEESAR
jgi:hypothetical protein